MSIETTHFVKRKIAIDMLLEKEIVVYQDDCNERLSDLLYENRDSIFENYIVVYDDEDLSNEPHVKNSW